MKFSKKACQSVARAIFCRKITLVLLCLAYLTSTFGQSSLKYVPFNAPVIMTMNLKNLDKKVNLNQLKLYTFYQEMIKEMTKSGAWNEFESAYFEEFMYAPENLGYDMLEPVYFFLKKEGDRTFLTLVIKMASRQKYETGLQKLAQDKYLPNTRKENDYMIYQDGKETYAWNDEVVVNVWTLKTPDSNAAWGYNDIPYDETLEPETWEIEEVPPIEEELTLPPLSDEPAPTPETEFDIAIDELGFEQPNDSKWRDPEDIIAAAEWAGKVLHKAFLQSIYSNERYRMGIEKPYDFHVWFDYEYLFEMMKGSQTTGLGLGGEMQKALSMMQGFSEVLYADTYLSMGLNFENGKMAIDYDVFFNEDMGKFYRGMFDVKFNKKFLRYVKGGNQFFGYYYMNFNIKKTIDEGKSLMYKLFEATPQYGEAAADAMKILGIFIDEKAIGNLLRGDLLLAVSGMQTVPVTTTTYEYDEDFNFTTKDTTILQTLPIFTGMLSYGNEKDIMKFINLGLHSKVLTQEERYYRFHMPGGGIDIYLAMKNGVLVFTNDRNLILRRLEKGYARKERLAKKHRKLLRESSSGFYWDIPNTLKAATTDQPPAGAGPFAYLDMMGKEFESIEMYSSKKIGDRMHSRIDFDFRNKNTNSLQQFFNFINDVYLEVIGGAKI